MSDSSPTDTYLERFGGIGRLYGQASLEKFRAAHVAIVGIGGVGSWVAEALARSGIGTLTLVDLDDICLTNTNRQIHAVEGTVGRSKIQVMAERLKAINPEITVVEAAMFFNESTAEAFFANSFDAIVDAIDSVRQKSLLLAMARERKIATVTVGGAGGRVDPGRIKIADMSQTHGDRLLMLTRKKLRQQYRFPRTGKGKFKIPCVYSNEPPRYPWSDGSICDTREPDSPGGLNCEVGLGSATHITASMGLFAAGLALEAIAR
ncbi:MAG: ThiF family adenylyltransferase [Puniceicoccaceae bacterium]